MYVFSLNKKNPIVNTAVYVEYFDNITLIKRKGQIKFLPQNYYQIDMAATFNLVKLM
jgi:hypothetical protein